MAEPAARGPLLRPLRHRGFLLIWVGQAVSSLGNSMYAVTIAWEVYHQTGSSAAMGLVLAAAVAPQLILTLFGGALADRLSRRTVILVCDLAAALITGALTAATAGHGASTAVFAAAAFALGVVSSFFGPAYSPIYVNVLPAEDQQAALAIRGATESITSIVGPALAGAVFAFGGAVAGFGFDAGSFVVSAVCTALVSIPAERVEFSGTLLDDIKAGLRFVVGTGWLRTLALVSLLANLVCVAPLYVLLPGVVKEAGAGSGLYGTAVAVQAVAMAVFSLVVGKYAHLVPRGVSVYLLAAVTGGGVALLGEGVGHSWLILPSMVLIGFGFAFNVVESLLLQENTPATHLSRVYSVLIVTSYALNPVGFAGAGVLARSIGFKAVLLGGGLLLVVGALSGGFATRWSLPGSVGGAERDADAEPEGAAI